MTIYKYLSFNTRGIRKNSKRRKLFSLFHNNKYNFVLLQETHSVATDKRYWQNEWGGKAYFSHGSNLSKGVAILCKPAMSYSVNHIIIDTDGRYIILNLNIENVTIELINVYCHNVDRTDLISKIGGFIGQHEWDFVIWGGDFNLVFNLDLDKIGGVHHTNFRAREKLLQVMGEHELIDIWRERNPKSKLFTWHSSIDNAIHCRLDFFVVSRHLRTSVANNSILALLGSDHSGVSLDLQIGLERGKGMWKLNIALLDDPIYIETIKSVIHNAVNSCKDKDPCLLWEICKLSIRSASISYSKYLATQRQCYESYLIDRISHLEQVQAISPSDKSKADLLDARSALNAIYDYKLKGIIIRSRARWTEEGEKSTHYFLNLEKRNKTQNTICELLLKNGEVTKNPTDILTELEHFYSDLYTKCNEVKSEHFFNTISFNYTKLSIDQQRSCEGLISLEECSRSLHSMPSQKSPGSDGLPVEFYKIFWDEVGTLVVNSFNYAFQRGFISDEQGRACITLIPKKSKDPRLIKNWRPIALLNTDYKILTKSIANRLKTVLPDLISHEQTGYLKGRYIGENVRLILDLINFCEKNVVPGALLFLDFEKAFDCLDWEFLNNTLTFFNFGNDFLTWIRTLYSNMSTCVMNNGYATRYFRVSRGVRQGCPLSPYLFITCTEVLNLLIISNRNIHGINIFGESITISNYADDTAIITDGSENSLNEVVKVLKAFSEISGLNINLSKSHLYPLGPFYGNTPHYFNAFQFDTSNKPITYLGISFTHHLDDFFELNYMPKLSRIKNLLNIWSSRDLTPIGKITIIKTFAVSQLVYLFTVLPLPPTHFFRELETLFYNFIWSKKPDKIKRSVLINRRCNGGLNMIDMECMAKSLHCKWPVKLYFDDKRCP